MRFYWETSDCRGNCDKGVFFLAQLDTRALERRGISLPLSRCTPFRVLRETDKSPRGRNIAQRETQPKFYRTFLRLPGQSGKGAVLGKTNVAGNSPAVLSHVVSTVILDRRNV